MRPALHSRLKPADDGIDRRQVDADRPVDAGRVGSRGAEQCRCGGEGENERAFHVDAPEAQAMRRA
jgi:hypothetical protein